MSSVEVLKSLESTLKSLLIKARVSIPNGYNWTCIESNSLDASSIVYTVTIGAFKYSLVLKEGFNCEVVSLTSDFKTVVPLEVSEYEELACIRSSMLTILKSANSADLTVQGLVNLDTFEVGDAELENIRVSYNEIAVPAFTKSYDFSKDWSDNNIVFWSALLDYCPDFRDSVYECDENGYDEVRNNFDRLLSSHHEVSVDDKGNIEYCWELKAPSVDYIISRADDENKLPSTVSHHMEQLHDVLLEYASPLDSEEFKSILLGSSWSSVDELKSLTRVNNDSDLLRCLAYARNSQKSEDSHGNIKVPEVEENAQYCTLLQSGISEGKVLDFIALGWLVKMFVDDKPISPAMVSKVRDYLYRKFCNGALKFEDEVNATVESLNKLFTLLGNAEGIGAVLMALSSNLIPDGSPAGKVNVIDDFLVSKYTWEESISGNREISDEGLRNLVMAFSV